MNQQDQEGFAAYLREATGSVPPSSLDLDHVFVSAKRKAYRYRTVVAGVVIAALGVGSLGVWQVIEHHNQPALGQTNQPRVDQSPAEWPVGACTDPAGIQVVFDQPVIEPVIEYVLIHSSYEGLSQTSIRTRSDLALDAEPFGSAVLNSESRQAIMRAASRNPQLPGFAVAVWGEGFAYQMGLRVVQWNEDRDASPQLKMWTVRPGDQVTVTGIASCGAEVVEFSLVYTHYTAQSVLWCGTDLEFGDRPSGELEAAAMLAWCDRVAPEVEAQRTELGDLIEQLHRLEAVARHAPEAAAVRFRQMRWDAAYVDGMYYWSVGQWWISEYGFGWYRGLSPITPFPEIARRAAGEVHDPFGLRLRGVRVSVEEEGFDYDGGFYQRVRVEFTESE